MANDFGRYDSFGMENTDSYNKVVEDLYAIQKEYKQELKKDDKDNDRLLKLMNKQLQSGLMLQMFQ